MSTSESILDTRLQGYISAIQSLSQTDAPQEKKTLRVVIHADGTEGIEAVFHRDIQLSWVERIEAWLGIGQYSLSRIVGIIQNSHLLAGADLHQARYLAFVLNQRIEHYNAKCWIFTIERVDFDDMVERMSSVAAACSLTPGNPVKPLSAEEQRQFTLYDVHLNKLRTSIAMTPNTVRANIQKWRLAHTNLATDLAKVFPASVPAVLQAQSTFIKDLIQALELSLSLNRAAPIPRYEVNEHNTLVVPADANCLYHCFRQVTDKSIPTLRREVAAYCTANFKTDGYLNGMLRDAVWDVNGHLTNKYFAQVLNLFQAMYTSCSDLDEETDGNYGEKAWDLIRPAKDNMKSISAQELRDAVNAAIRSLQIAQLELRLTMLVDQVENRARMTDEVYNALVTLQDRFNEWRASKVKNTMECMAICTEFGVVMKYNANLDELSKTAAVRALGDVEKTLKTFDPQLKAIEEAVALKKIPELSDEGAILAYIERITEDKFWGSCVELSALASIYKLQIKVTHLPKPGAPRVEHAFMMDSLQPRALKEGALLELDFEDNSHWNLQLPA